MDTHTHTHTSEGCLEPDGVRIFLPDQSPLLPDQWIQLPLQTGPPSHTSRACLLCLALNINQMCQLEARMCLKAALRTHDSWLWRCSTLTWRVVIAGVEAALVSEAIRSVPLIILNRWEQRSCCLFWNVMQRCGVFKDNSWMFCRHTLTCSLLYPLQFGLFYCWLWHTQPSIKATWAETDYSLIPWTHLLLVWAAHYRAIWLRDVFYQQHDKIRTEEPERTSLN